MSDLFKFYVLYKMNFKNILMKYLLKMLHLLDVLRYTALFLIHVNISVTYMINFYVILSHPYQKSVCIVLSRWASSTFDIINPVNTIRLQDFFHESMLYTIQ